MKESETSENNDKSEMNEGQKKPVQIKSVVFINKYLPEHSIKTEERK